MSPMKSIRYVNWQDDAIWIGYLDEYPDYLTQGESLQELEEKCLVIDGQHRLAALNFYERTHPDEAKSIYLYLCSTGLNPLS